MLQIRRAPCQHLGEGVLAQEATSRVAREAGAGLGRAAQAAEEARLLARRAERRRVGIPQRSQRRPRHQLPNSWQRVRRVEQWGLSCRAGRAVSARRVPLLTKNARRGSHGALGPVEEAPPLSLAQMFLV
jgi:hypothetical protein